MSYLKCAPSTRRFFEGKPFEAAPNDLPALFGLRVEFDPYMPDGFVALVGAHGQIKFLDLRPRGK
jgi:hypothetical protein